MRVRGVSEVPPRTRKYLVLLHDAHASLAFNFVARSLQVFVNAGLPYLPSLAF